MTVDNFKGYTGKSSNLDLVRTVIGLKSKHNRGDPVEAMSNKSIIELEKRFRPVRIRSSAAPLSRQFSRVDADGHHFHFIVKDLLKLQSRVSNTSPAFREWDFPPPDVMAELADRYFAHLNAYLGLLHRPTFERDVQNGLHLRDRGFGSVVLLVCATGSAWAYGSLHAQPHKTPGWQWFDRVSSANFSVIARPRLYDVQACAVRILFLSVSSAHSVRRTAADWMLARVADGGVHQRYEFPARDVADPEPGHPDGAGYGRASEEVVQRDADGRAGAVETCFLVCRLI